MPVRTFLVLWWMGIHLPMQGTRVRSLVQQDSTCRGATKVRAPQILSAQATTTRDDGLGVCASQQEKRPQWEATATKGSLHSLQLEKACRQQQRASTTKERKWILLNSVIVLFSSISKLFFNIPYSFMKCQCTVYILLTLYFLKSQYYFTLEMSDFFVWEGAQRRHTSLISNILINTLPV